MASRKEIEQTITDLVIKQLQEGKVPWRKPWVSNMPVSLSTGKHYGGINLLLLSILGEQYASPYWVTYKEAVRRGGNVKKGEKGTPIIKWSPFTRVNAAGDDVESFFLKQFYVFNIEQTENVPAPAVPAPNFESVDDGIQAIIDAYATRPEIYHSNQDKAYYSPSKDSIHLPNRSQFNSGEEYAMTLAHEIIHSTGHPSRLHRFEVGDKTAVFGDADYAKEELVADIGANMLLAQVGLEIDLDNSASYIAGWLKALQNDPTLLMSACGKAQKAVDFIVGKQEAVVNVALDEVDA